MRVRKRYIVITFVVLLIAFLHWKSTSNRLSDRAFHEFSKGDFYKAYITADKLEKTNPLTYEGKRIKSFALYLSGEKEKALSIAMSRPLFSSADVVGLAGLIELEKGNDKKALKLLKKASGMSKPPIPWVFYYRVMAGEKKNRLELLAVALSYDPENENYYKTMKAIFFQSKVSKEDEEKWIATLQKNPFLAAYQILIGMYNEYHGNIEKAMTSYRNFIGYSPKSYFIRNKLAVLYDLQNRRDEAKQELERSLQVNPNQKHLPEMLSQIERFKALFNKEKTTRKISSLSERVFVIYNKEKESEARKYMALRNIPSSNSLSILPGEIWDNQTRGRSCTSFTRFKNIREKLQNKFIQNGLWKDIDFIVLVGQFPYWIKWDSGKVNFDSALALLFHVYNPDEPLPNPYFYGELDRKGNFDMARDFNSLRYGFYLVVRLPESAFKNLEPNPTTTVMIYTDKRKLKDNQDLIESFKEAAKTIREKGKFKIFFKQWGDKFKDREKTVDAMLYAGDIPRQVKGTKFSLAIGMAKSNPTSFSSYLQWKSEEPTFFPRTNILLLSFFLGYTPAEAFYLSMPVLNWKAFFYTDPLTIYPTSLVF